MSASVAQGCSPVGVVAGNAERRLSRVHHGTLLTCVYITYLISVSAFHTVNIHRLFNMSKIFKFPFSFNVFSFRHI